MISVSQIQEALEQVLEKDAGPTHLNRAKYGFK
jgi:hypothetical protein